MSIIRAQFQNLSVNVVLHKLALGELLGHAQFTKYELGLYSAL